ncbi:outer membrane protein [Pelagovum pacificum]|uniref:Lipid A oxidase n=1 Tax=Pelagovum pacificum TaxID=2588711 RepID=A0A5C5GIW1_9RHOB|nr:outer membrane beta-barrel protein [Pelagovum pacificum]QQA43046.1 outer membrane beta-barrel protein [Pelagovum pacificum]TNY33811.1 lipid A oxidase [Pelagovum pacificum]
MSRFAFLLIPIGLAGPLQAETELAFHLGAQGAAPGDVRIDDPVAGRDTLGVDWEGRSASAPVYYGLRLTRWSEETGWGVDFVHAKVYAPADDRAAGGYDVLEFTDGLNLLTLNAYRRWPDALGPATPYLGGGIGIAVPHVEVTRGGSVTEGYQVTGPAATLLAGLRLPVGDRWTVFGEYKASWSDNRADLSTGGTLEAEIVTHALNAGVAWRF